VDCLAQRVVRKQTPQQRLADANQHLQRFGRLHRPDHARENTKDTGLGAVGGEVARRWLGKQASVAGRLVRVENRELSLETED
jgi:hypothetical protein